MNSTPDAPRSPAPSSYGFHCVLPKQDFAQALAVAVLQMTRSPEVAAVAQDVRTRLERVRAALRTVGT